MQKIKILFNIINTIIVVLYLYPGSILGFIVYKELHKQPQITQDFLSISSNHVYAFFILSFVGLIAYYKSNKILILNYLILSSIILIPLSFFFIFKGSFLFILFLTIIFLIALMEWFEMTKNVELKILGVIFLLFSFYSSFYFRNKDLLDFLILILICISTDIGGYIFGKLLKGPKLIKISPNKTYSGMFGGFLLAIIFSYLFVYIYDSSLIVVNELRFIIFVICVSSVSQIGDLIISYFKRSSKIKNTGKIVPGHGGILDRIDGMIFVFPFSYITAILS